MKYENPELATLSKARLKNFSEPISLLRAVLYGWFAFVFLIASMPFMRFVNVFVDLGLPKYGRATFRHRKLHFLVLMVP
jgi:hypothetical protein